MINTCTVTNIADRKSRQMLHKAKKMNPDASLLWQQAVMRRRTKKLKEDRLWILCLETIRKHRL